MYRVLGVIPARLESTRLPGKALRAICGRPMIAWVYENARQAACLEHLLMANEPAAIYVNIQGDEPMITPDHLERLLRPFDEAPTTQVSTLKVAIDAE